MISYRVWIALRRGHPAWLAGKRRRYRLPDRPGQPLQEAWEHRIEHLSLQGEHPVLARFADRDQPGFGEHPLMVRAGGVRALAERGEVATTQLTPRRQPGQQAQSRLVPEGLEDPRQVFLFRRLILRFDICITLEIYLG